MNLLQAVERASKIILRRDAETLVLHITGRDRAWLLAHPEHELTPSQADAYSGLVARRATAVPLQYLTGHQEFFGLNLLVTPHVLIPRPETELLVEAVMAWVGQHTKHASLVDVGTGSGAIALALATQLPTAEIWALDISPDALNVAEANARRHHLSDRVHFRQSDLLAALNQNLGQDRPVDVIVSNPPYVPTGDAKDMQPEVRDYEPHLALFAGEDGLAIYRRLIPQAWTALRSGGLLAMEIGYGQRPDLEKLLADWCEVNFLDDYAGIPRIALGQRS